MKIRTILFATTIGAVLALAGCGSRAVEDRAVSTPSASHGVSDEQRKCALQLGIQQAAIESAIAAADTVVSGQGATAAAANARLAAANQKLKDIEESIARDCKVHK